MKTFGIILGILSLLILIGDIYYETYGEYDFDKRFGSYWNLAEKASTIEKKSEYLDKYVLAMESGGWEGKYNAIFMETPDNSFDNNMITLKSLQNRLHQIKSMDVTSLQYQTAIQQITAQEQGEANSMLTELNGIWWKENHFFLWNWVGGVNIVLSIILCFVGWFIAALDW